MFELVPGTGGAEEEVLEVADPELPDLQQAAAHVVHGEQHGHSDLRAGQIQPQRPAVLRDPRPDVQQRLVRLSASGPCAPAGWWRSRSSRGSASPLSKCQLQTPSLLLAGRKVGRGRFPSSRSENILTINSALNNIFTSSTTAVSSLSLDGVPDVCFWNALGSSSTLHSCTSGALDCKPKHV